MTRTSTLIGWLLPRRVISLRQTKPFSDLWLYKMDEVDDAEALVADIGLQQEAAQEDVTA